MKQKLSVLLTMPTYNEADGIESFLSDLFAECHSDSYSLSIQVIDDCSTDKTIEVIRSVELTNPNSIKLISNSKNIGHGPSTIYGLHESLLQKSDVTVTLDGDGQFTGQDVRQALELMLQSDFDVLECVRTSRSEPMFRTVTSAFTRLFVRLLGARDVVDANTPFRLYRSEILGNLLRFIPKDSEIPNLMTTVISRHQNYKIGKFEVVQNSRRGANEQGTTWKARTSFLPSKRFLTFCLRATWQLFSWRFKRTNMNASSN
jgi:dolichol-phosphate mannosyltransferase